MKLKELKLDRVDRQSQIIVFEAGGKVSDSCDTLTTIDRSTANVFEDLDFMFGLGERLSQLKADETLKLECVSAALYGYQAYFDVVFGRTEDQLFYLCLYDFSEQYEKIQDVQQARNESSIKKDELIRKNKQIEAERDTIERLYKELSDASPREFIFIRADHLWVNLSLKDIHFVEGYGDYVKIHTSQKIYVTHNRLKDIEDKIIDKGFIRVHRSYIVKLDKITNFDSTNLEVNGKIIPVSASHKNALLEQINPL